MLELDKIYNMDCLEGMKKIDDDSIDLTITSPPYNLGGDFHTFVNGKRVTYGDYQGYTDSKNEKQYQQEQIYTLEKVYALTKKEGLLFYNHKNRIIDGKTISPLEWIFKTNWNLLQIVTLNFGATANVDKRRFFPVCELLFVLSKYAGKKLVNKNCLTDVWNMKKVRRSNSHHVAVFHDSLPRNCINASGLNTGIIFDPFVGTGTTCLVAKEMGFKYLGFDISKEYYNIALNRLVGINNQIRLGI